MSRYRSIFLYIFCLVKNSLIFTPNKCEKCPSSIRCQDSNSRPTDYESPLTTRPGLPTPFLYYVSSIHSREFRCKKMASVWIRTSDLWCRKPRLCQLWNIPEAKLMQLMHNYLYFEKNQWSLKSLDLFNTVQSRPLTIYFHDDWKLNIAGKMFDWRKISQMKILYSMALKTIWRVQSISDFFRANTKTVSSG